MPTTFIFHDCDETATAGYVLMRRVYDGRVIVKYFPDVNDESIVWRYVVRPRKTQNVFHLFGTEESAIRQMYKWFPKTEIEMYHRQPSLTTNTRE